MHPNDAKNMHLNQGQKFMLVSENGNHAAKFISDFDIKFWPRVKCIYSTWRHREAWAEMPRRSRSKLL